MTPSIRTFLLINLLLSVTLITSLAIIGNLFLAHKHIQTQLDNELILTTVRMQAFFSDYQDNQRDLNLIQQKLTPQKSPMTHDDLQFQIWNRDGKLILHTSQTPKIPLSKGQNGLSTLWLSNQTWRVNTSYNSNNGLTIMVAEKSNYRAELENQLTQDSVLIMLITYPFLGILIWIIVGRGLDPLKKVAREVSHRAPSFLKPVDFETVPTEIEPLVNELNSLFERLQQAFQREKRFTADAAHELRTPLAALNTHTQIALRASTAEERKDALLKVLAGVNRSTHVVQQLLTLNRMTPEAFSQALEPMDLAKEAAEIAAQLAPDAIAKQIDLELIADNKSNMIKGNPTAIGILIRNLVDNAIRYSVAETIVTIKIVETENQLILHVIDNGPGIPPELRERVFERFFRIIGTKASGSGLGLGIVQQISLLHKASIKLATPENGKGLDFQVYFPKLSIPANI